MGNNKNTYKKSEKMNIKWICPYCENTEEVYRSINDFIKQANAEKPKGTTPFKSYYIRSWEQDGKTWYDVGSHSEFFYTTKE